MRHFDPEATPALSKSGLRGSDFLTWLASWMGLALDRHWPVEKRRRLLKHAYRLYQLRGTPEGLRLHLEIYSGSQPGILEHFKLRRWMVGQGYVVGAQTALWGTDIINRIQLDEHARVGDLQIHDTTDPQRDPFWATAHRFSVFVPMAGAGETERQTVERIVAMSKPAQIRADVHILEPRFRIGVQSYIGIDSVIGRIRASGC